MLLLGLAIFTGCSQKQSSLKKQSQGAANQQGTSSGVKNQAGGAK